MIQNQPITIGANATDDVAVASVTLMVNGQSICTLFSPPYQCAYTVPASATTLTFGVTALDFGNNLGIAANVTVPVIPDPLTTATGRVINSAGTPVAGVKVSVFGHSALTAGDGTFSLSALPTILGPIAVTARVIISGNSLGGVSSSFKPILGGVISIGYIRILPIPFVTSISPKAFLAAPVVTVTVTGINLTGSSFTFAGTDGSQNKASSTSINTAGTSVDLTFVVSSNTVGRFP